MKDVKLAQPEDQKEADDEELELDDVVTTNYTKPEIDDAADILIKAEEIKANPELMKAATRALDKKKEAMGKVRSIQDLKDKAAGLKDSFKKYADGEEDS